MEISQTTTHRSSPSEVFLGKDALEICSKFTGEHPCRSVISIKLQSNVIEITLRHGCSLVILLHIFRTPFYKNTYGGLLLYEFPTKCLRELYQLVDLQPNQGLCSHHIETSHLICNVSQLAGFYVMKTLT